MLVVSSYVNIAKILTKEICQILHHTQNTFSVIINIIVCHFQNQNLTKYSITRNTEESLYQKVLPLLMMIFRVMGILICWKRKLQRALPSHINNWLRDLVQG